MQDGKARILLVDDEIALLNLTEMYLKRLGYEVDKRDKAVEALQLFESDPERFDVVVADLTMPEMPGKDLSLKMVELNPKVRILLCSGYPFEIASLPKPVQSQFGVLQKPFLPKMLAASLEELLKRP